VVLLSPRTNVELSVISGFRRDADEICNLLGYYAASNGNLSPTFRDNVSVPSSRVKKSKKNIFLIKTVDMQSTSEQHVNCFYTHFIIKYCHSDSVVLGFKRIPEDDPNRDRNVLEQSIVT
jgi:hypothetical protein